VTAAMSITLVLPFGFFASLGRGYLLPIGIAVLTMILGNLSITLGWGDISPGQLPAMYLQEVAAQPSQLWNRDPDWAGRGGRNVPVVEIRRSESIEFD